MCMELGVHSIKSLTLFSFVVHSSLVSWAQSFIAKLHEAWSSAYLAPFAQIACWVFHLGSRGALFVTKLCLSVCWEGRGFWWNCVGHWHWRCCGKAHCSSSWESLIKRWSWLCFLAAHMQAEGYLCLSCNSLRSVWSWNTILDGVWHILNAAAN